MQTVTIRRTLASLRENLTSGLEWDSSAIEGNKMGLNMLVVTGFKTECGFQCIKDYFGMFISFTVVRQLKNIALRISSISWKQNISFYFILMYHATGAHAKLLEKCIF